MTEKTQLMLGIAMMIVGGLFISYGAWWTWGLTGAYIAGGSYLAIVGAAVAMPDS